MRLVQRLQWDVEESPPSCYKYNLIAHVNGFWESIFWLGLGLEIYWEYCEELWILCSVEQV